MEIKYSHAKSLYYTDLSFTIPSGVITGITGDITNIIKVLALTEESRGFITYDKVRKSKKNDSIIKKYLGFLPLVFNLEFPLSNVYEYFRYYIYYYAIKTKDVDEKIVASLKIVGLTPSILRKNFSNISSSEKKLLQLALILLDNPKVLLLEDPFVYFSDKEVKKVLMLLEKLKDKFHKTIVIASNNGNLLYQITKYLIVLEKGQVYKEGMTESVYYDQLDYVKDNYLLPDIINFIKYVEQEKCIKLDHRKDVKDLMKDIYRTIS